MENINTMIGNNAFHVALQNLATADIALSEIRSISQQLHETHDALQMMVGDNDSIKQVLNVICRTINDLTEQLDEELTDVTIHNRMVKELMLRAS